MNRVSLQQAKAQLSRLVDEAARGEACIITRAGKPMAKIVAVDDATRPARGIGFMLGEFTTPDDFDRLGEREIAEMFNAS